MMIQEPQLSDHVVVAFVQKVGPVTMPLYGDPGHDAIRLARADRDAMDTAVSAVLERTSDDEQLTILEWGEKVFGRPVSLPDDMFDYLKES